METNETILTRKVVGIEDRKTLGKVTGLRVDCDTLGVSHYLVGSASTNATLVLPFEKALSVGDTFVTVQSRAGFLPMTNEARAIDADGFKLVGTEVYTKTGNRLGVVASFAFDCVFGAVTEIALDSGATFPSDRFVFFAPEFVFVDDGEKTAAELREAGVAADIREDAEDRAGVGAGSAEEADGAEREPVAGNCPEAAPTPAADSEPPAEAEPKPAVAAGSAIDAEPAPAAESEDEDAELIAFLLGSKLAEDVASADGAFTASKGAVLTQEVIDEARAHDVLLLLTMAVDE